VKRIQTRIFLADRYGMERHTFSDWLKRIGIDHNKALTPIELELIIKKIGTPEQFKAASARLMA
jgi:hypothetical protein